MPDFPGLRFDYNRFFSDSVGAMGLTRKELDAFHGRAAEAHDRVLAESVSVRAGFLGLPDGGGEARRIAEAAASDRGRFKNFVVLGIGGSALGAAALQGALNHPFHNLLPDKKRSSFPRVFVLDNIDPDFLAGVMDVVDVKETLFHVVSKSGRTAETMAQFMIFGSMLHKKLGKRAADHLVITTDEKKGPLRAAARDMKCRTWSVPANVGGRFSVLSPVGLVSAAYGGIDILGLLEGARRMREKCRTGKMEENPALFYAAAQYIFNTTKGANLSVLFAYSQKLLGLADWYRQLLAESLGKRLNLEGEEVFTGVTPVRALGVTDQHSQVQLYVEGPPDKIFTFLTVDEFSSNVTIPDDGVRPEGQEYLPGRSVKDLFDAELRGTELALREAGRPSCRIVFPSICPETIGQFFLAMELHIAYSGSLYGIDPYNQPGVERGKRAAIAFMGRQEFERNGGGS